jgi:HK97 family phage major capsid protein
MSDTSDTGFALKQVRDQLKAALDERSTIQARKAATVAEIEAIVSKSLSEKRDISDEELALAKERRDAAAKIDADLEVVLSNIDGLQQREALLKDSIEAREASAAAAARWAGLSTDDGEPAPRNHISVKSEPRTYGKHSEMRGVSFFQDAYNARYNMDPTANERLSRHSSEVRYEMRDITTSTFNGLIPPQYLLEDFAPFARAGRPFANVVPTRPLPPDGMSVISTKTTTGTATAVQSTQNTAATETDLVTTDITIPVVTITGQQDLSRQSIERGSRSDAEVFQDLLSDYYTKLGAQWLAGSGANGQSKGILTAATQTQTYTGTTVASFMSKVLGAANQVNTAIFKPATVVVMTSRRWHWLLAQSDTTGRPLAISNAALGQNVSAVGGTGYGVGVGVLTGPGLPVIVDEGIGTGFGVSTNEDRVIVTRLEELRGWEAPVMSFRFDETAGAPQSVRLAVFGYSAFNAERYTNGTALVVGSGLVAPSF